MNKIDEILQKRQQAEKSAEAPAAEEGDKFYSVLVGDAIPEYFLELRFANGVQTGFSYSDLMWYNYDPESGCIDLAFGEFLITIKGRGLAPLFLGIKQKRLGWVKEADAELQDNEGNTVFVEALSIIPPKGLSE